MIPRFVISGLALTIGLLLHGCCLVSERRLRGDDAGDARDGAARTDASLAAAPTTEPLPPGACATTCAPAELVGRWDDFSSGDVRRLLDVARIDDVLAVLVARDGRIAGESWTSYALVRFRMSTDIATLTDPREDVLAIEGSVMGGALGVRDGRFEAVVLRSDVHPALEATPTVSVVGWEDGFGVAYAHDLGPLRAPLPPCASCERLGAVFANDAEAIVGVGYPDGLRGAFVDLGARSLDEMGSLVTVDGGRDGTVPISGIVLAGRTMAVVGGGLRAGAEPVTAFGAWGAIDDAPLMGHPFPGAADDPPPRISRSGQTPLAWRFVADPADITRGAIRHWRVSPAGELEPIGIVQTTSGFYPRAMDAAGSDEHATLVWLEQRGFVESSLHIWQSDGEACTETRAHHAVDWAGAPFDELHGLVAMVDDAGVWVVTLGAVGSAFDVTAFLVPSCELTR